MWKMSNSGFSNLCFCAREFIVLLIVDVDSFYGFSFNALIFFKFPIITIVLFILIECPSFIRILMYGSSKPLRVPVI